jgi:hypothetical protein
MAARDASRAWHVTRLRRARANCRAEAVVRERRSYRRRGGTSSPLPLRRGPLSRRGERQQRGADRARPRGSPRLLPHPPPHRAPIRLAPARAVPHGQPLPPRPRNAGRQPLRWDARPERRLRTGFQRATSPPRPRVRAPLLVEGDRIGGAVREHGRLRRQQPGSPRHGPPQRGMALAVARQGPWGRFAWCHTTQTS